MYVLMTISTKVLHCLAPLTTDKQTRRFVFRLNALRQVLIMPRISVSKQHTAFILDPEERGKMFLRNVYRHSSTWCHNAEEHYLNHHLYRRRLISWISTRVHGMASQKVAAALFKSHTYWQVALLLTSHLAAQFLIANCGNTSESTSCNS